MRLKTSEQEERVTWSVAEWQRMNFVTVTLIEEEHDPKVISKRWTAFIKALKRKHKLWHFPKLCAIRVVQKHEGGHGWHIHALLDRFIPSWILLHVAGECGLGRIDFRMVSGQERQSKIRYVVRYICRDMRSRRKNPALKGVRLLTASGPLRAGKRWWKRLSDLTVQDSSLEFRKALQTRIERTRFGKCVFRSCGGRSVPVRAEDLMLIATAEDISWAHERTREIVASWNSHKPERQDAPTW